MNTPTPTPTETHPAGRPRRHPARTVPCPHCAAAPYQPCTLRSRNRQLTTPVHPARLAAWICATTACPTCQAGPGEACHHDGRPLHDAAVHPEREDLAWAG